MRFWPHLIKNAGNHARAEKAVFAQNNKGLDGLLVPPDFFLTAPTRMTEDWSDIEDSLVGHTVTKVCAFFA